MEMKTNKYTKLSQLVKDSDFDYVLEAFFTLDLAKKEDSENISPASIRRKFVNRVLAKPLDVLNQLPLNDLVLIEKMAEQLPENKPLRVLSNGACSLLADLCLATLDIDEENELYDYYSMPDDLLQAMAPHVKAAQDYLGNAPRFAFEQIMAGALNLYGVLTKSQMKQIFRETLSVEDDGGNIVDMLMEESAMANVLAITGSKPDDIVFYSFFCDDEQEVLQKMRKHDSLDYVQFDINTLRRAGDLIMPQLPNKDTNTFVKAMRDAKIPDDEIQAILVVIWSQAQILSSAQVLAKMTDIIHWGGYYRRMSEKKYNKVLEELVNYLNNTPRWELKGHTPARIFQQQVMTTDTPCRLTPPVGGMPHLNMPTEDASPFVGLPHGIMPFFKVAPNEPCPCGSGKRFKDCHGIKN